MESWDRVTELTTLELRHTVETLESLVLLTGHNTWKALELS